MTNMMDSGIGRFIAPAAVVVVMVAGQAAEASIVAASYVPNLTRFERSSRGIGESQGTQRRASNTFTSSETGKLTRIRVAVSRRISTSVGLTVDVFPAVVGQELPDMSGGPLGSVTVPSGDVPQVDLFDANATPADLLFDIDFTGQAVMLQAGQRYAFLLSADGATNGNSVGYGFLAPISGGNGVPGGNLAEDNGSGLVAFPFDYDMVYEVHVPEPASLALLGLGGLAFCRRRWA